MPDLMTRADSLREFLTGASSDGGTQISQAASLGNFRSSSEWGGLSMLIVDGAISNTTVLFASGGNNLGAGELLLSDVDTFQWKDNGNDFGDPTEILGGETKLVESSNPSAFLRVSRTFGFSASGGPEEFIISTPMNNIFGENNVTIAQAAAGVSTYRATIMKNVSADTLTSVRRWIKELGTSQVSNSAQLSGSGAGTITTTGSFADWPKSGYCHIFTSGGAERELVYYSARTSTSLTVPAAGRGLLGTSAAAGANTDVIRSVPGVAVAIDTVGVTTPGSIQIIANETTAPAAVTWNRGNLDSSGLQIGTMNPGQQVGIWFWRQIPAGAVALPYVLDRFGTQFDGV